MKYLRRKSIAFRLWGFLVWGASGASEMGPVESSVHIPVPATTAWGTRGLSQTASAEALGAGRFNLSFQQAWYRQGSAFPGAPNADADIVTGTGVMAFGINDYFDFFGGTNYFTSSRYTAKTESGLGTGLAGLQGSIPLPQTSPLRLGMQGAVLAGQSKNQINVNHTDGYNYFETRTGYDLMGRLMESFVAGGESRGFKLHLNQGVVKSLETGRDFSLLLALGAQAQFAPAFSIGVEVNSRTSLRDPVFRTDPVWVTPTMIFRTPSRLSITIGGDISAARERTNDAAVNSLEPFRLFGSVLLSFDCLEKARLAALRKAARDSTDRAQCARDAEALAAFQKRAVEDSLRAVSIKKTNDSLFAVSDSLLRKSREDSVTLVAALAEARRLLELEKARRSDMEKKLLSTGMLILDAVYFESAKTEISMNSKPYLKIIGKMLEKYPKLALEVGGHTDNTGNPEKNVDLSQRRSEAVRNFLVEVAPGLSDKLTARGYGPSAPKEDNKTKAGRKANRRVELRVMNPDALKDYN